MKNYPGSLKAKLLRAVRKIMKADTNLMSDGWESYLNLNDYHQIWPTIINGQGILKIIDPSSPNIHTKSRRKFRSKFQKLS